MHNEDAWATHYRFPEQNVITLSEEILGQKFTFATPQVQLSFVQGIQRLEYVTPT